MWVEQGTEIMHCLNWLNIHHANMDWTVINFQQLLSQSDYKKLSLAIIDH